MHEEDKGKQFLMIHTEGNIQKTDRRYIHKSTIDINIGQRQTEQTPTKIG